MGESPIPLSEVTILRIVELCISPKHWLLISCALNPDEQSRGLAPKPTLLEKNERRWVPWFFRRDAPSADTMLQKVLYTRYTFIVERVLVT